MIEGDVLVACVGYPCNRGTIYVPEVGPMGDEWCTTVAEAVEWEKSTGRKWVYVGDGWLCPDCAEDTDPDLLAELTADVLSGAAA